MSTFPISTLPICISTFVLCVFIFVQPFTLVRKSFVYFKSLNTLSHTLEIFFLIVTCLLILLVMVGGVQELGVFLCNHSVSCFAVSAFIRLERPRRGDL